ncbi:GNAT family N-acetyltransferase [Flavobacterium luteum]|uniref:GNAT family N-acetyltransferase n=1 Tax=Flavobacterium luteum TaxID=2026654 RepID=A0A7J5AE00_9FLAO|nr:GNAT family N-acetyltransferase [Flavobacterium luteum]KAB1155807.1 GNAT family N-acetyltransferase [Flavobacterium luteum]
MIEIIKYESSRSNEWDNFVSNSRIDSFIFFRDFMDYHSHKFVDFSLMIYKKGNLDAVIPGNIDNDIFYSHQGLTYGGVITSVNSKTVDIINYFNTINIFLKNNGLKRVVYKSIPYIYNKLPTQEDLYVLFKLKAQKIACNISSTIYQNNKLPFIELRKRGSKKAKVNNVEIIKTTDFRDFWTVLEDNLIATHGVKPVHTINEITFLHKKFPDNIVGYTCLLDSKVIAGCVLFVMKNVVHVQYISANDKGKEVGALDLLFENLIIEKYNHKDFFDFGQSTEQMGAVLNENLIFQKEGFGARGVCYDTYKYDI